ncbi:gluconate 2-dehydrogenase subunit 3 family protein [Flagellimonas sp.]|uniref:gluconate 2-dehydrogenase subunit 3 family protein n=1 Tax=Flagellimonas sp. TaxID=2058762 RepID=UPI003BAF1872
MKRREAIVKISWVLNTALITPSFFAFMQSCREKNVESTAYKVLDIGKLELIKEIADTFLPKTNTPSASEVNVHLYLDLLLKDVFEAKFKKDLIKGLEKFDENCQSIYGRSFVLLDHPDKIDYLEKVETESLKGERERVKGTPFYLTIKKMIIAIYFSTEEGVKQNLNYVPVPGPYIGEVPYNEGDKITIGNHM